MHKPLSPCAKAQTFLFESISVAEHERIMENNERSGLAAYAASTDTVTALKRAQTISNCLNCIVEWDEGGNKGWMADVG